MSYDKLNSYYNDKLLLPIKQKELVFDNRDPGIFKTKPYNSSIVEYFIEGKGWIKEIEYERCRDNSGLSPKDYNDKYLTNVCACYIDTEGKTGTADMDKETYDMLTEKTYSKDYEAERKRLYDIYNRRMASNKKPIEEYAVSEVTYINDDNSESERYRIYTATAAGEIVDISPVGGYDRDDVNYELYLLDKQRDADVYIISYDELRSSPNRYQQLDIIERLKSENIEYKIEAFTAVLAEGPTHYIAKYKDNVISGCLKYGSYFECNDELRDILKMHEYGYTNDMMHPIFDKEKALEAYDNNKPVYMLYADGTEARAGSGNTIETFSGIFGIERMDGEPKATPLFLSNEKEEEKKPMDTMEEFIRISHNDPDKAFDYFTNNAEKLTKSELISICRELIFYADNMYSDRKIGDGIIKATMAELAMCNDIDLNNDVILPEQNGGRN